MKFSDIVKQAILLLQDSGRITYRTLKREFDLDDEALDDLKYELIEGQEVATDKDAGLTLNGRKPPIFHSLSRIFPTYMKVKRKS